MRWDGCVAHAGQILRPIPGTGRISTKLEVVAPEKAISGDGSGIGKPPMHENRHVAEELLDRKPDTTLDARIQLAQAWSKSCLSSTRFRHLCFLSDRKCFNPARDGQNVMSTLTFTLLLGIGSCLAGLLGSLTGLGGGVVIVPLLTLAFGVDFRYAVGASLVAVIATSSGAAAVYVREGFTNIRIGMLLEVATTVGALAGRHLAGLISTSILAVILGLVLLYSAYAAVRTNRNTSLPSGTPSPSSSDSTDHIPASMERRNITSSGFRSGSA